MGGPGPKPQDPRIITNDRLEREDFERRRAELRRQAELERFSRGGSGTSAPAVISQAEDLGVPLLVG